MNTPGATAQPQEGSLQITKTDTNGNPLSGVGFTLYDSSKQVITTKTTNGSGVVLFSDLELGSYYYAETSALPYYSGSDMWSHDFCLDLGYGYNYVIPHTRWVCNATLIGRAGLKYTKMERDTHFSNDEISSVIQIFYGDNVKSKSDYSFALNPSLRIGIGYSHDKWFFGSNIVFDYYLDKHLDTFMFNARLSAGYRFNLGSLRIGKK